MLITLKNPISIYAHAAVGGKTEYEGPLGKMLDYHDTNDRFSQDSWEKAEAEMQRIACNLAMAKAGERNGVDIRVMHEDIFNTMHRI